MDVASASNRIPGGFETADLFVYSGNLAGSAANGEIVSKQAPAATDIHYPGCFGNITGDLEEGTEAPA
jgi:hypothetical protein